MNNLEVDGHRITYTEADSPSNPPVILISGIMSHHDVWTRTLETLKDNFRCIAIDQLGFGDSGKPKGGDYAIAKQAECALKIADCFGVVSILAKLEQTLQGLRILQLSSDPASCIM